MEKKKLAILIRGQSKNIFYSHKKIKILDYNNFHQQYRNMIEKFSVNYDIDIFIHTYKNKYLDENEILKYYNPKSYNFTESIINENIKCQSLIGKNIHYSLKSVIEVYFKYCADKNKNYDLILMMRYDWFPNENTDLEKLNPNYFNVYGIFYKNGKIYSDDNILITSHENLKEYMKVLENISNLKIGNLHFIVQLLNINKIFDMTKNQLVEKNKNI